jgi:hypothetical protein
MGMVLVLVGARDATIDRLLADPPLVWQLVAPDDPDIYAQARARTRRRGGGFLGMLFGRSAPPPAAPVPDLELADGEGATTDIDKSWHGIHYLLTQTAWGGDPPLNFLAIGGESVGAEDVGYGPARAFRAAEVAEIAVALDALSDDELRARFDPTDMTEQEIYPEIIWARDPSEDDTLGYLMANVSALRSTLGAIASRGHGMVITIS